MIHKRWPLHPKPKGKQLLYDWIKDLANLYEVSYQYFCSKVLNLTNEEIYNFRSIRELWTFRLKSGLRL